MSFPKPANEAKRLNVLWQYGILDTVPEAMFDDLAELASAICGAPIALISLVDKSRQWFKSKIGLSARETSRDTSMCAHAICQSGLFIVPDASRDSRFKNNPLVKGRAHVRFYAGAPLVTPDGYALGTICVLDKVPRGLSAEQQHALELLARIVMAQLELRRQSLEHAGQTSARAWSAVTIQQAARKRSKSVGKTKAVRQPVKRNTRSK